MRFVLVGLIAGVASGAIQFWLLSKFTRSITGGVFGAKVVFFAVSQFLLPFVVLLVFAVLFPGGILWSGVGMASTVLACAFSAFFLRRLQEGIRHD